MKEFIVDVPNTATKEWGERELINIAYGQMETLRGLGFDASVTKGDGRKYLITIIGDDGKTYADGEEFYLDLGEVTEFARFIERVQVQKTLNLLTLRMAKLGWVAGTNLHIEQDEDWMIRIKMPDGITKEYKHTNASMLQLSLDLDKAEVEWELGQRLGLFHRHGWQFIRWTSGDGYSLCKKRGLGHSDQVLHIHDGYLEEAWEAIDKIESEIKQAEPAEKVAKIFE